MTYVTTNTTPEAHNQYIIPIPTAINSINTDTLVKQKPFNLKRKSQLNKIVKNADSSPDYLAICIYWDTFRSWYAPNKLKLYDGSVVEIPKLKTKGIYFDYNKLAALYACSKETIRKKLVKLEKLGLIQRSFKHRSTSTTKSYNQMIIYVWKETPYFINKYGINQDEIIELNPQTNHKYITEKYNIDYQALPKVNQVNNGRGGIHTLEDTKELIEPFNKLKDRSMKSNFIFKDLKEKNSIAFEDKHQTYTKSTVQTNKTSRSSDPTVTSITTKIKTFFFSKPKKLSEFHPLTSNSCSKLRSKSGRDFTDNAINEILLDMSKRLTDRSFRNKKGFMSYMSKALMHELRDAVKISNINFKIKANCSKEEIETQAQEKYLAQIEYSTQVSPEWHLKKKLASVLERSKAYKFLTNYQYSEIVGNIFRIHLRTKFDIGKMNKKIILSQVKATQERIGDNGDINFIENIEFIYKNNKKLNQPANQKTQEESGKNQDISALLASIKNLEEIKNLSIWQQIRKKFMDSCFDKEEGVGRDKNWLSKLEACANNNNKKINQSKTLTLTAKSSFIRDWVNTNYLFNLESIAQELGYKLCLQNC